MHAGLEITPTHLRIPGEFPVGEPCQPIGNQIDGERHAITIDGSRREARLERNNVARDSCFGYPPSLVPHVQQGHRIILVPMEDILGQVTQVLQCALGVL